MQCVHALNSADSSKLVISIPNFLCCQVIFEFIQQNKSLQFLETFRYQIYTFEINIEYRISKCFEKIDVEYIAI